MMAWALSHHHVVLTHDLDFGALLALTHARGPSVIQVCTQDVTPAGMRDLLIKALQECAEKLEAGALVIVDEARLRARILPLGP
jgi:predicted nuclease of predicted toxin-antitoxin system